MAAKMGPVGQRCGACSGLGGPGLWVGPKMGVFCLIIRAALELSRKAPDELLVMIEVEVGASARGRYTSVRGRSARTQ